jgi:NADH-quinone oxidoreductase subunit A
MNTLHTSVDRPDTLWPLVVYMAMALAMVMSMLVLSWLLGQRHADRATGEPYESTINATGSARLRLSANLYLIAMFFVIFDLEAMFIFTWAVATREVGWIGYIGVVIFISVSVAAYLISDGSTMPYRVRIRTPSFLHLQTLPLISRDHTTPDLLAILGSLDFMLADVDWLSQGIYLNIEMVRALPAS